MSEKDNIKLKTDTLSSRKSSASVGVHVKRKRKIIAKPVSKEQVIRNDVSVEKKELINSSTIKKTNDEKKLDSIVKVSEPPTQDIKSSKKQKDPNLASLELSISDKIGLNVSIKNKNNNSGSIIFEYKDINQLNKIIEIIKSNY